MLGDVCLSKPTEDFDFALIYQHLRFEWLFQKYQKLKTVSLDRFVIRNKIIKYREYIR